MLGIDPGYERVGIAVVEKVGGEKETLIYSACFKTSPKSKHAERLGLIATEIKKIIEKFKPNDLAIEELFFGDNKKTAIKVAEARGVILAESALAGLSVYEYKPVTIKVAVTGYGRSTKDQVTKMVQRLIKMPIKKTVDDEFDAIAIALTHTATKRFPL